MAVFLQGCNLRCRYCHNPETQGFCATCGACVPACPGRALSLEDGHLRFDEARCQACERCVEACPAWTSPRTFRLTPAELLERVRPVEPFLDGLTFSGGECTLQVTFLMEATRLLKKETRLTVLADTNGFMESDVLEQLAQEVDGFLFDLKAMETGTHLRLTGEGNAPILRNLTRVAALGKVVEVRTVVVPGFTDTETEIRAIAQFVRELPRSIPLRVTPFRPHGVRGVERDWPQMDPDRFETLCGLARETLGSDRVRTAAL